MATTDQSTTGRPTTGRHRADARSNAVVPRRVRETTTRHGVDPHAEPSAEWGWHGSFPKITAIAGWITALSMFAMLIGNHQNYVEDLWLIGIGTLLVVMLIGSHVQQLRSRRR